MPKRGIDGVARTYKRAKVAVVQKARKNVVSEAVKKYVKKFVESEQESKIAVGIYAGAGVTQTDSLTTPLTYNAIPSIYQGAEQSDRVGSKIKVKKMMYRYVLNRVAVSPANAPIVTYVVVGRLRNSYDTPSLTDFNMLKIANTAGGAFTKGPITSLDRRTFLTPFNLDVWDIKLVKKHKVWNQSNSTSLGTTNNDFSYFNEGSLDLTPYIKKDWRYMDTTNQLPENEGLYVMFFGMAADGLTWTNGVAVDTCITVEYYDA